MTDLGKNEEKVRNRISEGPAITHETWFALALSSMIIAVIVASIAALWVIDSGDNASMVQKAQAFTPFGGALLALVTFFTVAWRGVLNTQQLEQQRQQLEQQRLQVSQQIRNNDANDEANLAKLLQEGAKMLGDKEREAQALGGIATLEILILDERRKFSLQAMNLLADFYLRHVRTKSLRNACLAARRTLAKGLHIGLQSEIEAVFESDDPNYEWEGARGFASHKYVGGKISNFTLKNIDDFARFIDVNCKYASLLERDYYYKCSISHCSFDKFSAKTFATSKIELCDFSGTRFIGAPTAELEMLNCYYVKGTPPTGQDLEAWLAKLQEVDKPQWWRNSYTMTRPSDLAAFDLTE